MVGQWGPWEPAPDPAGLLPPHAAADPHGMCRRAWPQAYARELLAETANRGFITKPLEMVTNRKKSELVPSM